MNFIVLALPRSRTFWLSQFLTYNNYYCSHEELRNCRSLQDVKSFLSLNCFGSAETAAAPWWRTIRKLSPETKILSIRRKPEEVISSLCKINLFELGKFPKNQIEKLIFRQDLKLSQVEKRVPCFSVPFEELDSEETIKKVFEFCLPFEFDKNHHSRYKDKNLQTSTLYLMRQFQAFKTQHIAMINSAKQFELGELKCR
jgi:hypothetical protein